MTQPEPIIAASEAIRFPRLYVAIKWTIITSLILLALLAAAFWTLVLGGFAASGFRASNPGCRSKRAPGDYARVCVASGRERAGRQGGMPDVLQSDARAARAGAGETQSAVTHLSD
jgi:hypothetical protein